MIQHQTKQLLAAICGLGLIFSLAACSGQTQYQQPESHASVSSSAEPQTTAPASEVNETTTEAITMKMKIQIGMHTFTASLEDNATVHSLIEQMQRAPIVIHMSDYAGFEKVGALESSLPISNSQTTTHSGDIVLYNGNQIVIFYGSNTWNYTRLGKIDDLTGWEEALGDGDVTVTFSLA